ncbi:MAG: hypothetical protein Q7T53_00715 [Deltaproteobacteria bacterium]|nr:hypothetical protein [Deltaproteobacteria bacterium]
MKRVRTALPIALMVGILGGCSNAAPKCGDQQTVDTVIEIAGKEIAKQVGQEASSQITLSVNAIRTTDFNKKTGAQSCAAQLVMKGPNGEVPIDITYTSEKTDKSGEVYVSVFGLK